MDALPTFFDDAILDEYEDAIEIADPISENPLIAIPDNKMDIPAPVGVPPPVADTPAITKTSDPLSETTGTPSSSSVPKIIGNQCKVCKGRHPLRSCTTFLKLSHERKLRMVVLHHYCSRCLAFSHTAKDCTSTFKCRQCKGNHNTLLHSDRTVPSGSKKKNATGSAFSSKKKTVSAKKTVKKVANTKTNLPSPSVPQSHPVPVRHVVAFSPTLLVRLQVTNNSIPVRAALDPCCSISYICESLVRQLRLPISKMDNSSYCRLTVVSSFDPTQRIVFTAKVTKMQGVKTPSETVSDSIKEHFAGFQLADPRFNISGQVALVLGPELTPQILKGKIYSSPGLPMAQYTIFGWVISGQSPL